MKKQVFKLLFFVILIVILFFTFIAAVEKQAYDSSNIEKDLFGAVIDGKVFDINGYNEDKNQIMKPIYFSEFCFSENFEGLGNYALYIYIYNPQNLHININSNLNKISLADEYNEIGDVISYKKYNLVYCTRTDNNMIYKFKIKDLDNNILNRVLRTINLLGGRRYDVSGIEIQTYGDESAKEYSFGISCTYNGYARGYGSSQESTLTIKVDDLETINLNVNHTNYLTGTSSTGAHHRDNISSVYFGVPNSIIDTYGFLEKIEAEWNEYQTKPIIVTSNNNFYDELIKWNNTIIDDNNKPPFQLFYGEVKQQNDIFPQPILPGIGGVPNVETDFKLNYDWAYSINNSSGDTTNGGHYEIEVRESENLLPISFYSKTISDDGIFSYLNKNTVAGNINSNIISKYLFDYTNSYGKLELNKLNDNLLTDTLDPVRINKKGINRGYNNVVACLSDTYELKSYNSNHNWVDRLNDYGFIRPDNLEYDDIKFNAIQPVTIDNSDTDISKKFLINDQDIDSFRNFYNESILNDCTPYLFRFAISDYYSRALGRYSNSKEFNGCSEKDSDTYLSQQTIFLDFDIISLTFLKKGKYTIIPAVSNPNDIVSDVVPPPIEYSVIDIGIGHLKEGFLKFRSDFLKWWNNSKDIIVPIIIAIFIVLIIVLIMLLFNSINKKIMTKKAVKNNNDITIEIVNKNTDVDLQTSKKNRKKSSSAKITKEDKK